MEEKLNKLIIRKAWSDEPWNVEHDGDTANSRETSERNRPESVVPDLRDIMKEAENEKLLEENEKKTRACNIILHGVSETADTDQILGKQRDEEYVSTFNSALGLEMDYKAMYRLGKRNATGEDSKRPMKLILRNDADKNRIMASLKNLKGREEYKGISVKDDYTIQDRNLIKQWVEKAKNANPQEPVGSKYEWKVRGTPKNGMFLKRFQKRVPTQRQ